VTRGGSRSSDTSNNNIIKAMHDVIRSDVVTCAVIRTVVKKQSKRSQRVSILGARMNG
jgi:hypothetical protein